MTTSRRRMGATLDFRVPSGECRLTSSAPANCALRAASSMQSIEPSPRFVLTIFCGGLLHERPGGEGRQAGPGRGELGRWR